MANTILTLLPNKRRRQHKPSSQEIYRAACQRSHRILACYLALWAWRKRVDCVCLDRSQLLSRLGLDAMRGQRCDWLTADVKPLFPYTQSLYFSSSVYGGLFLSRRRFPKSAFDNRMEDNARIELLGKLGLATAKPRRLASETRMIAGLAGAATGTQLRRI